METPHSTTALPSSPKPPIEIPKVMSTPSDPTAPSFLTLPVEIRNGINEFVFVQGEPLPIHNADFYYNNKPLEPKEDSDTSDDEDESDREGRDRSDHVPRIGRQRVFPLFKSERERYREDQAKCIRRLQNKNDQVKEFSHHSSIGLGLMISCRQLYHETTGLLYSKNTIIVSRVLSRHDRTELNENGDKASCHQLIYAPR